MQPYIAINLQTTGLITDEWKAPRILSLAMVYDDLKTPINELPHLYINIDWSDVDDLMMISDYSEEHLVILTKKLNEYRKSGHEHLFVTDKKTDRRLDYCKSKVAMALFDKFLRQHKHPRSTIRFCGNNISNFILYTLCYNNFLKNSAIYGDNRYVHHSPFDVANFFTNDKEGRFAYYEEAVEVLLDQDGPERDTETRHHALINALNLVKLTRLRVNEDVHSFSL